VMVALTPETLSSLPPDVEVPTYDRGQVLVDVVHLGVGGF